MKDIYTKYYWDEGDILFYHHFRDNYAIKQIEIRKDKTIFISEENPIQGEDMLYDGKFEDLEVTDDQFITKKEFEEMWSKKTTTN